MYVQKPPDLPDLQMGYTYSIKKRAERLYGLFRAWVCAACRPSRVVAFTISLTCSPLPISHHDLRSRGVACREKFARLTVLMFESTFVRSVLHAVLKHARDTVCQRPCTRDCSSMSLPRIDLLARSSEITG